MATLTGKITDVTGRAPDSISSITVKAPSARIGSGTDVIVSSPAVVTFDKTTGDITIGGLTGGLSWLYIEGDGWTDSIPLAVADGMITLVEAIANAAGTPGLADFIALLTDLQTRIDNIAQDAVDTAIGGTTHVISAASAEHAGKVVRLNDQGKLHIGSSTVTNATDPANKHYVDLEVGKRAPTSHTHRGSDIVSETTEFISFADNRFANQLVRLNANGKFHITTAGITGLNDPVNKQYVDNAVAGAGGGQTMWWN